MKIEALAIPDVKLITPLRVGDHRGWFSEVFKVHAAEAAGVTGPFIQDNQSFSARPGTLRGLHCQVAPDVQGKLVRVVRGAVWDVAVDARRGTATYGQHVAAVLSAENGLQLWVPRGFLHGFVTLEPDTEILYKVTAPYNRAAERGVIWNDPTLAVPWPLSAGDVTLSERDATLPPFAATETWFPD